MQKQMRVYKFEHKHTYKFKVLNKSTCQQVYTKALYNECNISSQSSVYAIRYNMTWPQVSRWCVTPIALYMSNGG